VAQPVEHAKWASTSEMAELIRTKDWAQTPLGPMSSWSPSLRMMVPFLLANRFPLLLWWGPEFCQIYNDAYRPILGTKHPHFLGRPVRECWSEIWHVLRPLIETPFRGGPSTWMEDIQLEINRYGFMEETHFTIAYSPVPDETVPSGIGGVLATVHEISEKVVGQRRVVILRDLSAQSLEAKTADEACTIVAATLAKHALDVPFALLYLIDQEARQARLAGTTAEPGALAPLQVSLDFESPQSWPLGEAVRTQSLQRVEDLSSCFGDAVPPGPWSDPPREAVVVPIRSTIASQIAGLLVMGLSSRLQFDESYRDFIELASTQIATAIGNARAYEEERKRAEALAAIDRAKTAFFSNVSHEFRTPLTLMLGPIEDVLSEGRLGPEVRERLDVARRNSHRLHKLVNTLLDFSRIEAGRIQALYEPVDISTLTADLASVFRAAIERANMSLIVACEPIEESVYVDREMWEKIVLNLLSNAFKFTFDGEIRVSLRRSGASVELEVADTGTGIPPAEIPHVFERFHRVRSARGRSYEGSGIGLALVSELAKLHGGTVDVRSKLDRGTTFTVRIPLGAAHLPSDRIGPMRSLSTAGVQSEAYLQEALRWLPDAQTETSIANASVDAMVQSRTATGQRILVVDDNSDMRQYVRRLLEESGYDVVVVADGEAALHAVRTQPINLVLTDVMMPKLDGFGLIARLREDLRTATVPVILLSARAGEESRVEGLAAGADDYLVKPFSARELAARVESHLKLARLRQEEKDRSDADLEAMAALHESGTRCARAGADFQECVDSVLAAAIKVTGADKGHMQVFNDATGRLEIVAQRGFDAAFLTFSDRLVQGDNAACAEALRSEARVLVEDVSSNPLFTHTRFLDVLLTAGVRAVQSTPLVSSSGKVLGIISTHFSKPHRPPKRDLRMMDLLARQAADYLERKQADEALRTREAQLRTLFDAAPLGVFLVDADFRIRQVNPMALPAFGDTSDLIGKDFDEVIHRLWGTESADRIVQIFRHTLETAEPYISAEWIDKRRDRDVIEYYEWRVDRIPLPDGRYGVVCHFRDIAAQVQARRENERLYKQEQRARKAAEQAAIAKDEFLAVVSHELRSPLNAILGYNRMLRAKGSDDLDVLKAIDVIERNGRMQVQLIEDLLDTARIISGKMKLEVRPVELTDIVAAAFDTVRSAADSKSIALAFDADSARFPIMGDAARLQQVVWNLLSNAVKFTPEGGRVHLALKRKDAFVQIEVEDTGKGIDSDLLPYVFDRFKQGDSSASRRFGGLGLGLSLVRQLIELHGGSVKVESDGDGRGARFTVTLPTRMTPPVTLPDTLRGTASPRRQGAIHRLDHVRILVVDDDELACEGTVQILREYGADAHAVRSASLALDVLEQRPGEQTSPFDVLISDIGMPGQTGYELIRRVRAHHDPRVSGIRAAAVTAYARSEDRIRALEAGYQVHIAKPLEEHELTTVIAALIGKI